ncbi:MAG: GNAT family N-acetyltransferase [Desulfobacter postgatei]|uniref:GNAT family N-acetyltransferase n=1 Tax=Desulfobacter postgatei TaxID=2293 RepID=A0A2G6MSB1_9BACT|nr:MAG: GNAT family N-acetyltransferase [Desulfobacter postgatei]
MIRKALIDDVAPIHALLKFYAEKGELLGRPLSNLYDHLRDFWVYEDEDTGKITGCAALAFCWEDIAEIRSVAIKDGHHGQGIGSALTERCIQEAFYFKLKTLFTLTYRPKFFTRFGFEITEKANLPMVKVWAGCLDCVKFPDCDEIAMIKQL